MYRLSYMVDVHVFVVAPKIVVNQKGAIDFLRDSRHFVNTGKLTTTTRVM